MNKSRQSAINILNKKKEAHFQKQITSLNNQNLLITFIHELMLLTCLILIFPYIFTLHTENGLDSMFKICCIVFAEMLDMIAYRKVIAYNDNEKEIIEHKLQKLHKDDMTET